MVTRTGVRYDRPAVDGPVARMRNLTQAMLYPGIGLLETAMSVGRGTDTPFEVIGAPYIDDVRLARRLNALGQAGVTFVPVRFTPDYSVHKDESCGGVNIIITDREALKPVMLGIDIARVLHAMYPEFPWPRWAAYSAIRRPLRRLARQNPRQIEAAAAAQPQPVQKTSRRFALR